MAAAPAKKHASSYIDEVRLQVAEVLIAAIQTATGVDCKDMTAQLAEKGLTRLELDGRMAFAAFFVGKRVNKLSTCNVSTHHFFFFFFFFFLP